MTRTNHRAYGSWIFGAILLIFVFAVFWLAPDALPSFKQQILAFSMALLAGLFGFFLTGDMALAMQHKESSTSLKAAGGIALFVLVLAWWQSSAAPIIATEKQQTESKITVPEKPQQTPPPETYLNDAVFHPSPEDAERQKQHTAGNASPNIQADKDVKVHAAIPSNSSISSSGNLMIEATGNGKVNVVTGNGQIQQAE